jgi:hypothetical protein
VVYHTPAVGIDRLYEGTAAATTRVEQLLQRSTHALQQKEKMR